MAELPVIVLAGGGHACVLLDTLARAGVVVHGVLDPGRSRGETVVGVPVLGSDDYLAGTDPAGVLLVNGLGVTKNTRARTELHRYWAQRGFRFLSVLHPSVVASPSARLERGAQVLAGVVLQHEAVVGANAVINTGARVDHHCRVGAHAFVAPGAVLCGAVAVDEGAFVGAGAVVLPGIRVGAGAVVGAGSVVTRDVEPGMIVVGNPAAYGRKEE